MRNERKKKNPKMLMCNYAEGGSSLDKQSHVRTHASNSNIHTLLRDSI